MEIAGHHCPNNMAPHVACKSISQTLTNEYQDKVGITDFSDPFEKSKVVQVLRAKARELRDRLKETKPES